MLSDAAPATTQGDGVQTPMLRGPREAIIMNETVPPEINLQSKTQLPACWVRAAQVNCQPPLSVREPSPMEAPSAGREIMKREGAGGQGAHGEVGTATAAFPLSLPCGNVRAELLGLLFIFQKKPDIQLLRDFSSFSEVGNECTTGKTRRPVGRIWPVGLHALVRAVLPLVSLRRVPLVASFSSSVRKEGRRSDFIWPSLEGTCYLVYQHPPRP